MGVELTRLRDAYAGEAPISVRTLGSALAQPPALRTALDLCFDSRLPMVIWWGAELRLFYNDAAVPVLGAARHAAAFGQPGRAHWPELWRVIGPMLERTLAQGDASASE